MLLKKRTHKKFQDFSFPGPQPDKVQRPTELLFPVKELESQTTDDTDTSNGIVSYTS